MKISKSDFQAFLTLFTGSIIALLFAIINKYPLVYPDTGTYLTSGFEFYLPFDRPVFYGLFLRFSSLGLTLWLSIFAHSFILVYLIREFIIYALGQIKYLNIIHLLFIVLLSGFTTFSYTASEVIADIFTPCLLLCIILWQKPERKLIKKAILLMLTGFCLVVHNSHFIIFFGVLLILWMIKKIFLKESTRQHSLLIFWAIIVLMLNLTFNFLKHKGFRLSRVPNTFLFSRMLESGAVHTYLADHPEENDLISNNIQTTPKSVTEFLWNFDQSVLYRDSCFFKRGCEACWSEKEELFNNYLKKVLLYGPSRNVYLKDIGMGFIRQLGFYKLEALGSLTADYPVKTNIKIYMKWDYASYLNALQYQRKLFFTTTNSILGIVMLLSLLVVIFGILFLKNKLLNSITFCALLFYMVNAFVCSAFSITTARYSTRISWILPLIALLFLTMIIKQKLKISTSLPEK